MLWAERSKIDEDKEFAWNTIGADSVYCFFLSTSWRAWIISFVVIFVQAFILYIFVGSAEMDFSDNISDFKYSWICPRNSLDCSNTADLDWRGWFIFAMVMIAFLFNDFFNGLQLLWLCTKQRHYRLRGVRYFFGGLVLVLMASYTFYVTYVYNRAIARSNTEIATNCVIILYLTDLDERAYRLVTAVCPGWVENLKKLHQVNDKSDESVEARLIPHEEDKKLDLSQVLITKYFGPRERKPSLQSGQANEGVSSSML